MLGEKDGSGRPLRLFFRPVPSGLEAGSEPLLPRARIGLGLPLYSVDGGKTGEAYPSEHYHCVCVSHL